MALSLAVLIPSLAFIAWPLSSGLLSQGESTSLRLYDRDGGLLRELRSRDDGRGIPLPKGEPLPEHLVHAFVAAEDARFWAHPGVDPLAIARAAAQNVRAGRIVSGASTLPQQLARRLVPRERTLLGKAGEALWAMRLVFHLPKDRILREHLDRVPLGNSNHGVEAAARFYFDQPAAALSVGQAALLAGMAQSPARFDPFRHHDRALQRMRWVLGRMVELGLLSEERAQIEGQTPLDLVAPERAFGAPHLMAHVVSELEGWGLGGATAIRTTLDPSLQRDVEALVTAELEALVAHDVGQAAILVVDNATGDVLAYVGSASFWDGEKGGQNDGVQALRQPGSALKPFAYGLAIARGFTAATVLEDVETHLSTPSGAWMPRNYDRRVHGPVRLRAALQNSYNVPAVRVAEALGAERLLALLAEAGFESLDEGAAHYGAGIVLGNGDVSLWEMARGFRGLARGGVVEPLRLLLHAEDPTGSLPLPVELEPRRFLPEDAVALLTDILSDEAARAPAFGIDNALRLSFPVAAKTGTSRAYVDNWTVGYTAERTVAVWVGNFDGAPMRRVSGITGAGPLFGKVMERAMEGVDPAPLVDRGQFVSATICPLSGELAGPACAHHLEERFLPGTEPREICTMHRFQGEGDERRAVMDPGPRFALWAQAEGRLHGGALVGEGRGALLLPMDGDEYLLDPSLPSESQTIPVRVIPPAGVDAVEVRVEGWGTLHLESPFASRLELSRGTHRLEVWVPGEGRPMATARFAVR